MEVDEMVQKMLDNIKEDTGKTVADFVKIVQKSGLKKHGEIRNLFKNEHGMSYGHANTLAHVVREEIEGRVSESDLVDNLFAKKADLKPIYDRILEHVEKFGDDVEISPKKTYVSLRGKKQFALLKPSTKTRFDVGLILKDTDTSGRLEEGKKWNAMCTHRVKLGSIDEVDVQLIEWLRTAYGATL
jgi:hypothetical protein